jgi:hypothetical protein
MQKLHLIVGGFGFILFLYSGAYMYFELNQLVDMEDGKRMFYRSSHIYILLTSFFNIMIGLSYKQEIDKSKKLLQTIASIIFLTTPFILLGGFFIESVDTNFDRPYTKIAIFLLVFAVILSVISKLLKAKEV